MDVDREHKWIPDKLYALKAKIKRLKFIGEEIITI